MANSTPLTLEEVLDVLETAEAALDDASSVVDAGEDEDYAYQAELELIRDTLIRAGRRDPGRPVEDSKEPKTSDAET